MHRLDAAALPEGHATREAFLVQPRNPHQQVAASGPGRPANAAGGPGRPAKGQLCMLPLRAAPIPGTLDSALPRFDAGLYGEVSSLSLRCPDGHPSSALLELVHPWHQGLGPAPYGMFCEDLSLLPRLVGMLTHAALGDKKLEH